MPIAKQKSDIAPLPAGLHRARCVAVIDLGTQPPTNPQYKPSRKVHIEWELPDVTYEKHEEGRGVQVVPRRISRPFGLTLGKKSTLRGTLESWRGKAFTNEELEGFDLAKLLGVPCYINIIHNSEDGETYANISSISPLPAIASKDMPPQFFGSVNYDIDQGQNETFKSLPDWLREKIGKCLEWGSAIAESNGHSVTGPEAMADDMSDVPF
jgi:hypothetical protein